MPPADLASVTRAHSVWASANAWNQVGGFCNRYNTFSNKFTKQYAKKTAPFGAVKLIKFGCQASTSTVTTVFVISNAVLAERTLMPYS